ncbi:Histidine kinase (fragment) [Burkholderia sp. 8Y]|uniref:response regulator n=1 Tax=Burkholderia sp. 8Y TaxID=2653133 RepID=UPI0012F455A5
MPVFTYQCLSLFDLFSQGARTLDRSEGGLGIGLSLVKRLVQMHDGSISIDSAGPGQGTSVSITLPRVQPRTRAETPTAGKQDEHHPGHTRILIVDDNKDAADSLGMLCQAEGHETTIVYEAHAAVAAAKKIEFDVALLDIGLPDIDGHTLAPLLRAKGSSKPVLVAITGYGRAEDRLRSQAAGFDHHLVKPVNLQGLLAILDVHRSRDGRSSP